MVSIVVGLGIRSEKPTILYCLSKLSFWWKEFGPKVKGCSNFEPLNATFVLPLHVLLEGPEYSSDQGIVLLFPVTLYGTITWSSLHLVSIKKFPTSSQPSFHWAKTW